MSGLHLLTRAVPGTSRRVQLRAIATREARLREIWLDIFRAWTRVVTVEDLRDIRRSLGVDVSALGVQLALETGRREKQLVDALTRGAIERADAEDFVTPLGPLTVQTLAENQIGRLVVEVDAGALRNLREQLVQLFQEGPTDDVLRGIAASTGLTRRQTRAVQNFRRRLLEGGTSVTSAGRQAEAYALRSLRRRAQLIARTESVRFTSAIVEARALEVGNMVKQWVSARDGNVEGICQSLDNGQRVPAGGTFSGISGQIGRPPAHPGCRCVLELSKRKPRKVARKRARRAPVRRPRPPPPAPTPPKPPPAPVGEARTAAQVGAQLERVAARREAAIATAGQRRIPLGNQLQDTNRRLNAIIDEKAALRRKAGIGTFDQVPDELFQSPAWKKLTAEQVRLDRTSAALAKRLSSSLNRQRTISRAAQSAQRAAIRRPPGERNLGTFTNRASKKPIPGLLGPPGGPTRPVPSRWSKRQGGVDDFREIVSKRWLQAPDGAPIRVPILSTKRNRSFMRRGEVHMSTHAGADTVVHEIGHAVEWFHPEVLQSSLRFWRRRTAGEASERLSKLVPGSNYSAHEIARKDAFIDAYVGKDYGGAYTEIVSMGLEYMQRDPLAFWRKDPDHFSYIWDIMRGIVPQ